MNKRKFYLALRVIHQRFRVHKHLSFLARWVKDWGTRHPQDIVITNLDGDLRFKCSLDMHIGSQIFWHDCYSYSQMVLLGGYLKDGMVYVDVGANVGEQTVFAAKRLRRGKVIAFEPTTSVHRCLVENVAMNGFNNVVVVKAGLGETPAELPIYTAMSKRADGTVNEGVPTLYRTAERSDYVEKVPIFRFDDFVDRESLERVDVMKIDVEGAELAVLKGAAKSITRFWPLIVLEIHEGTSRAAGYGVADLLAYVKGLGYRIEGLRGDGTTRPFTDAESADFRDAVCFPLHRA